MKTTILLFHVHSGTSMISAEQLVRGRCIIEQQSSVVKFYSTIFDRRNNKNAALVFIDLFRIAKVSVKTSFFLMYQAFYIEFFFQ